MHVLRKRNVVEPLKQVIRQHHARGRDSSQLGEVSGFLRHNPILQHLLHPSRADAEIRHL